jgi:hypothetical protein
MATSNITVTTTWTKVADDTDDPVTIQCVTDAGFQVAGTSADSAPDVIGKTLSGKEQIANRDNIGPGYLWVRLVSGRSSCAFVVDK